MIGILTEKPSAGRNFATALGGTKGSFNGEAYVIVSARGHLYEFAQPEQQVKPVLSEYYRVWNVRNLPWNEDDFSWKRVKKKDADSALGPIKAQLSACDEIVIATDVDPTGEGELLAWEILDELNQHHKKWSRMYFTDEAPKSIQKAFVNRKQLKSMLTDMDYVKADYRSKFDFMTMQFTRIATASGDGHSVLRQGRLKSAMVLIVGDQLKAIAEYKKIPFYQARFKDDHGVTYINPDEPSYPKKDQVPTTYHASSVTVDSKTMKTQAPPKMLDLASLSALLSAKGYKAQHVLDVYQKMYEAQIVSYPRTEDKVITPEQFNEMLPNVDAIATVVGVDKKLLTHRQPRATHVKTGGAHGANRPGPRVPKSLQDLSTYDSLFGVKPSLTKGLAAEIYTLLARNYLATLCEDYEYEAQVGHVTDYPKFKGSANVPKKQGWKAIFGTGDVDEDENASGLGSQAEPFIHEGYPPVPLKPTMKWLMKQLEKRDVGTGATRTSIYAEVTSESSAYPLLIDTKGAIKMAPCGDMSYRLLPGTHIGDLKMTEQLQADMRDIAAGKVKPEDCLYRMRQMVVDDIKTMEANGLKMREELGVKMISGENGYCRGEWNGKEIRFKSEWCGHTFTDEEAQALLDGEEVTIIGAEGKNGPFSCRGRLEEGEFQGKKYVGFKPTAYLNDDGSERTSSGSNGGASADDYYTGKFHRKEIKFKRTWGGHRFTDEECQSLLSGDEIFFDAVSSKTGNTYVAHGKLAKQEYQGREFYGFKPDFNK